MATSGLGAIVYILIFIEEFFVESGKNMTSNDCMCIGQGYSIAIERVLCILIWLSSKSNYYTYHG